MLHTAANEPGERPPVIPLRRPGAMVERLRVGQAVRFAPQCPLPPLKGALAEVIAVRHYQFGEDTLKSFQLRLGGGTQFSFTLAEDEQGHYLSLSRQLSEDEQDRWFGRDALSFFTEPSSARAIRCKADLHEEGEWAAARYSKTVDWVEGSLAPADSPRLARAFHYNQLVNEGGDKSLEIEHDDASGENRVMVTVFRPLEDIAAVEDAMPPVIAEPPVVKPMPTLAASTPREEPPLFQEPVLMATPHPKQRQDFRRLSEEARTPIHIERTEPRLEEPSALDLDLPSFLIARPPEPEPEPTLTLTDAPTEDGEQVRISTAAVRALLDTAERKNVRMRDVLRDMLGLESALAEEVILDLPISDADYRTLAMRYKLRPDHRLAIRARLEAELRQKLHSLARG